VHFTPDDGRHVAEYTAHFHPDAELPDEYGQRLMKNPKYLGWFKVLEGPKTVGEFACVDCDFEAKTKAGLGAHRRKHSKQRGENETVS
jgi:hypothetical protein